MKKFIEFRWLWSKKTERNYVVGVERLVESEVACTTGRETCSRSRSLYEEGTETGLRRNMMERFSIPLVANLLRCMPQIEPTLSLSAALILI